MTGCIDSAKAAYESQTGRVLVQVVNMLMAIGLSM